MGVAIRDILADCKETLTWDELSGTAAVDAHNALYQFLSIIRQPDGTPLMNDAGEITSHLSGILFRTVNFLEMGIKPVFVFDGKPPEFKQETIEERRLARTKADEAWKAALREGDMEEAYRQASASSRIDSHVITSSHELLDLLGIPWVQAPSEGEAQAAYMVQEGKVTYSVSQDYDSLLFGSPVLVRNLTVSGRRKIRGRTITVNPERIVLSALQKCLGVTREQLIEIGILVGTDFNPGIRGIGGKTALKIVRSGAFDSVIAEKQPEFDPDPIREFFLSPPVTDDYTLEWRAPDVEGVVEMLCGRYDFSEDRVRSALAKVSVKAAQKTLDAWF
ncbi:MULTISPECIES: flap endonuclease-1 [Methanoculleus]|jgi:flap endonuclease-1|uniref:Flap endonuclease 1 n=1 Tax=Methanoculleus thermophilus TaxID=2200 RepID=A0A1G8XDR2_9EURY|nr:MULTISPECIES: flap endonuclease-1 [Methanoculleus]NLN09479.1 flap endonuclease-1 [Methanoculleus thermophilus]SDJ88546.1 flap endonuclease 1 [Methanoculleus thermophilus]HQD25527.1 flap endonuclease-1 [Methanoculleus thermophilus]